jgi:E3 ubiquitin-protein ligase RAD18
MPIAAIPVHIDKGCPPPKAKGIESGNQKSDWKKVFAGAGKSKEKG